MDTASLEFLEHAQDFHRARHEKWLVQVLGDVERLVFEGGVEQVLGIEDAAEFIEAVATDREYILLGLADEAQIVLERVGQVEPQHLRARRHEGIGRLVAHMEYAVDHGLLAALEGTVLCALFDEVLDLVFRDSSLLIGIDAEQQHGDMGGAIQHDEQWTQQPEQQ